MNKLKWITIGIVLIMLSIFFTSTGAEQVEKQIITIDPVSSTEIGSLLVLSGTTSLPEGSDFAVTLIPYNNCTGLCSGSSSDGRVKSGPEGVNTWSIAVDTSSFGLGNYVVNVSQILNYSNDGLVFGDAFVTQEIVMTGKVLINETAGSQTQNNTDGFIFLNETQPKHIGDKFLILGSTNLPIGTDILWEMGPDQTKIGHQYTGEYIYSSANSEVVKGNDSLNRVSHAIDTSLFKPGVYNITCSINKGDLNKGEWKKGDIQAQTQFTVE